MKEIQKKILVIPLVTIALLSMMLTTIGSVNAAQVELMRHRVTANEIGLNTGGWWGTSGWVKYWNPDGRCQWWIGAWSNRWGTASCNGGSGGWDLRPEATHVQFYVKDCSLYGSANPKVKIIWWWDFLYGFKYEQEIAYNQVVYLQVPNNMGMPAQYFQIFVEYSAITWWGGLNDGFDYVEFAQYQQ